MVEDKKKKRNKLENLVHIKQNQVKNGKKNKKKNFQINKLKDFNLQMKS